MQINPEVLSEKNYTGTRLLAIDNEKVTELQAILDTYQKELNPTLDKLQADYYPKIDPLYKDLSELTEKAKAIKTQIKEITDSFKADTEYIEQMEQKATLVKNKMQPLILKEVEGKLGEFETAKHTTFRDGKLYVEVFDEIEEKIKFIRQNKVK